MAAQSGHAPSVQAHAGLGHLDRAELQAACDLRAAVRFVAELERDDLTVRPETYRRAHARDLARARLKVIDARVLLDDVFRGGS